MCVKPTKFSVSYMGEFELFEVNKSTASEQNCFLIGMCVTIVVRIGKQKLWILFSVKTRPFYYPIISEHEILDFIMCVTCALLLRFIVNSLKL